MKATETEATMREMYAQAGASSTSFQNNISYIWDRAHGVLTDLL